MRWEINSWTISHQLLHLDLHYFAESNRWSIWSKRLKVWFPVAFWLTQFFHSNSPDITSDEILEAWDSYTKAPNQYNKMDWLFLVDAIHSLFANQQTQHTEEIEVISRSTLVINSVLNFPVFFTNDRISLHLSHFTYHSVCKKWCTSFLPLPGIKLSSVSKYVLILRGHSCVRMNWLNITHLLLQIRFFLKSA